MVPTTRGQHILFDAYFRGVGGLWLVTSKRIPFNDDTHSGAIRGPVPVRRARLRGARRHIVDGPLQQLATLRGLPQKLGQLLSLGDFVDDAPVTAPPVEYGPTLNIEVVKHLLSQRLEIPFDEVFASIESTGIGASLGQVHRATLHDGRVVAVKLQLPEMEAAIRVDAQSLALAGGPAPLKPGLDLVSYRAELLQRVEQELDYRRESEALATFSSMASRLGVTVPRVVLEYTRRDVLVMDWCEGEPFSAVRTWSPEERAEIARVLVRFFLTSIFELGRVHADPQPGNFRFTRDANGKVGVTVLDFGSVLTLDARGRRALMHLVAARLGALALTADDALGLWLELGFNRGLLEPLKEHLPRVGEILFRPFASTTPFDSRPWQPAKEFDALLGEDGWNFRLAAPPSLLLLLRTVRGLVAYLDALESPVAWRSLVIEALNRATPGPRPSPKFRRE